MSKVAAGIKRGLEQALAYARGEADKTRYRVHVPCSCSCNPDVARAKI